MRVCPRTTYWHVSLRWWTVDWTSAGHSQKNCANTTTFAPKLNLCIFNYHLLKFTRNLKLIFSQLPFLLNYASDPDCFPGFVLVINRYFHLSFTIRSFDTFYFMDELGSVLLNKQAFFMFSSLNHFKSTLVTLISHEHTISCFSFF
jgi:hypothetical protein